MNAKEKLEGIRDRIDEIDAQLIPLFAERMQIAEQVAAIKRENNMAIFDEAREQQVVDRAVERAGSRLRGETSLLMRSIMALSRERQRKLLFSSEQTLLPLPRERKTEDVVCAFQGVPGAWSEQALVKLFPKAKELAVDYFEDVFIAVKEKKADYGIVPIENSKTGAIGETYDLLRKYGCFIVGRIRIDIAHCLLAPKNTRLDDIREVYSHPEGFKQCMSFLRHYRWEQKPCSNTAVAARLVAENNGNAAAIGSRRAAELNGLLVLAPDIMDRADNRTSFVVVAAEPEYDDSSDIISVTFSTAHRSGALCETLMPFMAQGINLIRIESRPAGNGKYRFFADLQGNITEDSTAAALREAAAASDYFEVLGCCGEHKN